MRAPGAHLRSAALLLVGALAVHDLRVVLGYGGDAELILSEPAHAYLPFATGAAVVLALLAAVHLGRTATGSRRAAAERRLAGLRLRWMRASGLLVVAYLAQAGAESFFDPGHPIVGHGGWTVLPLAMAVGFPIALASREADEAVARRAVLHVARYVCVPVGSGLLRLTPAVLPRLAPLASNAAGRAPPPAR